MKGYVQHERAHIPMTHKFTAAILAPYSTNVKSYTDLSCNALIKVFFKAEHPPHGLLASHTALGNEDKTIHWQSGDGSFNTHK